MIVVFLCLAYFTEHNALEGHACCCRDRISLFLRLSDTPLYIYTTPSLSAELLTDTGAATVSSVVHNAAVNMGVQT